MKKIISVLLALVMVLSILPISAIAGIADNNPPYSTGMDDTGFYFLKVPEVEKLLTNNSSGTVGWGSSAIAKNSKGNYANGYGAGHFVVERNGEYFIEFDYNDVNTGDANTTIDVHSITYNLNSYGTQRGVSDLIDTTNLNYLAIRLQIEGGEKGTQSVMSFYDYSELGTSFWKMGTAVTVDYKTREVKNPGWSGGSMVFTEDFDGWVIVPVMDLLNNKAKVVTYTDAEGNEQTYSVSAKEWLFGEVDPINGETNAGKGVVQLWFHHNCTHINVESDWVGRNAYVGDMIMLESVDKFVSARFNCDLLGHELETLTVAPTCTEKGYTVHKCKHCDHAVYENYVAAKGHSYTSEETDANCTDDGYITYTCSCGYSYNEKTQSALGHKKEILDEYDGTGCGDPGYIEYGCTECDYFEHIDIIVEEHIEKFVKTVAPTCTEKGYDLYKCQRCGGDIKKNFTDEYGHSYTKKVTNPTCIDKGYTTYTCHCGNTYIDDYVEATGHTFETSVVEPTQVSQGYTNHSCKNCPYNYNDNYRAIRGDKTNIVMTMYGIRYGLVNYLTDGVNTDADKLRELEDIFAAGYINNLTLGPTVSIYPEVVKLCKKYNVTLWMGPSLYNSKTQHLDVYMQNVEKQVEIIKANDAWDITLGFFWDEPIWNGQTNEDYYTMTKALYETYGKRTYSVFAVGTFIDDYYANPDDRKTDLVSTKALTYTTDIGWDAYGVEVRPDWQNNASVVASLKKSSAKYGIDFKTGGDYYRFIHNELMEKFDHEVTTWFYPCAYECGTNNGTRADEGYMMGHLEFFTELLLEQENPGGIHLYTYTSGSTPGIDRYLTIPNIETGEQISYPDVEKYYEYSELIKKLKKQFDETEVYLHTDIPSGHLKITNKTTTSISYEALEGYEYSIDGRNYETDGLFDGLMENTVYTIFSRRIVNKVVTQYIVVTSKLYPHTTPYNDTSSYIVKMPEEINRLTYATGWPGTHIGRLSDDTGWAEGDHGSIFIRNINGERMIEAYKEPGFESSFVVNFCLYDTSRAKDDGGLPEGIDTENLSAFAFRIKTSGGVEGQLSTLGYYIRSAYSPKSFTYISLDGTVTQMPYKGGMVITDDIDGWIVIPFSAYSTLDPERKLSNREWIAENLNSIQFWMHDNEATCKHGAEGQWLERKLFVGDMLVLEDMEVFIQSRTNPDSITVKETCADRIIVEETPYTEFSVDGVNWQTSGTFTGLKRSTTYTVYARGFNSKTYITTMVKTGANHTIKSVVVKPTCTEQGYTQMSCSKCDYSAKTSFTNATGHSYVEDTALATAPTCTEAGTKTFVCSSCSDSYIAAGDKATGHNFVAGEKVAATPSAQGYTIYNCTNCDATEKRDFVDYVEPQNKVTGVTVTPTDIGFKVTWNAFEGATGYYVRVRNSANTTNIASKNVGNVTSYEFKLGVNGFSASYDEEYIIQVIAYTGNVYQKYTDADQVRSQMVITNRVVDVKATPYGHGAKVTFRPIEGATIYWVYVRNAADDSAVYTTSTTTTEAIVVNNMIGGTEYYVQVVAFKNSTQLDKRANAIKAKFTAPYVLPSKYNIAAKTPTTFSITWDAVAGATTYFVQVRTMDDAPVRTVTVHNKTIAAVAMCSDGSKLSANTTYKFRIAATINGVTTGYGDWMTYTTGDYETVTVNAEKVDNKVKISWNDISDSHAVYLYKIDANGKKTYFKYLENGETSYTIKAPASGSYSYGVITVQRNMSGDCYNPIAVSNTLTF